MSKLTQFAKRAVAVCAIIAVGWGGYEVFRPAYDGTVGIAYGWAYAPVRDRDVSFDIWYPARPGGKAVTVGGNGVFFGTPAGRRAPRRDGTFPLVIISHGAGGNAGQFGWIASKLADSAAFQSHVESPVWAVSNVAGDVLSGGCCVAENGRNEPTITDAAVGTNVGFWNALL